MGFLIPKVIRFVLQEASQQQEEWKEQVIIKKRWPGKQAKTLEGKTLHSPILESAGAASRK